MYARKFKKATPNLILYGVHACKLILYRHYISEQEKREFDQVFTFFSFKW